MKAVQYNIQEVKTTIKNIKGLQDQERARSNTKNIQQIKTLRRRCEKMLSDSFFVMEELQNSTFRKRNGSTFERLEAMLDEQSSRFKQVLAQLVDMYSETDSQASARNTDTGQADQRLTLDQLDLNERLLGERQEEITQIKETAQKINKISERMKAIVQRDGEVLTNVVRLNSDHLQTVDKGIN